MTSKRKPPFDPKVFLAKVNGGRSVADYRKGQIVYTQGEPADFARSERLSSPSRGRKPWSHFWEPVISSGKGA